MRDALVLLLLGAAVVGVGTAVALVAGLPARWTWAPTILGLAPALGLSALGLAASVGAMVGIDVRLLTTGALVLVALTLAGWILRSRRPGLGTLVPPRSGRTSVALELACLGALAALSVGILRLAAASDLEAWDAWALWGPKAHALFVDGDAWSPVFREASYEMQHQEYPILLPALEALSAEAVGRFDTSLIDIMPAALVVAFGWAVWAVLRLVVPPVLAAGVALALTGSAPLITNAAANYADSVVAVFTALGLLALFVWLVSGASAIAVTAGVFLAAAASSKVEGLVFVVCAIVAALTVTRGFGRSIRSTALLGIGALAVPCLWLVVDRLNGPGADNVERRAFLDPGYAAGAADRLPTAFARFLEELGQGWPLVSVAVVTSLAVACLARLWWRSLFVALWGALVLAGLTVVYYASTAPIDWLLVTSADRVVFSVALALGSVTPLLVAPAWTRTFSRTEGGSVS